MNRNDNNMERTEKILRLRKLSQVTGNHTDPVMKMLEEFGGTGLRCADQALDMGINLCERQLAKSLLAGNPVVIPPPPQNTGHIIIGNEAESGQIVWLPLYSFCRGMVMIGTNGSGKTIALACIIFGLPATVRIYAPDSKHEIVRIFRKTARKWLYVKPDQRYANILDCPTDNPNAYYLGLLSLIAPLMELDDQTWPDIAKILNDIRVALPKSAPMPAIVELPALLENIGKLRKKAKFSTAAAKFRILAMAYGAAAYTRRGPDLWSRFSAISLDHFGVAHMVRHVTDGEVLFRYLNTRGIGGHTTDLDLLFGSDEGLDFLSRAFSTTAGSGKVSIQEILTAQGRSFGIGRVALFQSLAQADGSVLANSLTRLVFCIPDYPQAKALALAMGLPEEAAYDIQNLKPGECFLKSDIYPTTIRVRTLDQKLGGYPSETEIQALMQPEIDWMRDNSILAPREAGNGASDIDYAALLGYSVEPVVVATPAPIPAPIPSPVMPPVVSASASAVAIIADWAMFLEGVQSQPGNNTSAIYAALGLSGYKGNKLKTELLAAGLISVERVRSSGRPQERLNLTEAGKLSLEGFKAS